MDGFFTSEDGDLFLRMLEGIPNTLVDSLPFDMRTIPSNINHMLVLFHRDRTASVYVNEILFLTEVEVGDDAQKEGTIREDDITSVERMVPEGIDISNEDGLMVLISVGWRKGLFFDFRPLQDGTPSTRQFDLSRVLGRVHSYLLFQNRHRITDDQYGKLTEQKWFPFTIFDARLVGEMLDLLQHPKTLDQMIPKVRRFVDAKLQWLEDECLQADLSDDWPSLVRQVFASYSEGDYDGSMSASRQCILHLLQGCRYCTVVLDTGAALPLVRSIDAVKKGPCSQHSELLPVRFKNFIECVFLKSIAPDAPDKDASDSTETAEETEESRQRIQGALVGILCLHQLVFFTPSQRQQTQKGSTESIDATSTDPSVSGYRQNGNPTHRITGGTAMTTSAIMLVDDEVSFVETMTKRLSKRSIDVFGVFSGEECLEKLKIYDNIEVVILDVKMPGMGGIETLKIIKQKYPLIEVIMLTGHATVKSGIEGMKLGAYDYLMKPCEIDELLGKVDGAVKKRRAHEKIPHEWERFMDTGSLTELMVPLEDYATVSEEATIYEAICALEDAQNAFNPRRYRHRAILVLNQEKRVVGKLNQHDIIQALEPQYKKSKERSERVLSQFGFGKTFIDAVSMQYGSWDSPLQNLYKKTFEQKVKSFMHIPTDDEYIEASASLNDTFHRLIVGKYQSLLVTNGPEIVGVLRLTDVFDLLHLRLKALRIAAQIDTKTEGGAPRDCTGAET